MEEVVTSRLEKKRNSNLRLFAVSFSIGMTVLGSVLFFRHPEQVWWSIPAFFILYTLVSLFFFQKWLGYLKHILDLVLKSVFTIIGFLSLSIFFFLIFSPYSIALRIFKKDQLRTIAGKAAWTEVSAEHNNPANIERLY